MFFPSFAKIDITKRVHKPNPTGIRIRKQIFNGYALFYLLLSSGPHPKSLFHMYFNDKRRIPRDGHATATQEKVNNVNLCSHYRLKEETDAGMTCPVCKNSKEIFISLQTDRRKGLQGKWEYHACENCGLIFILPLPCLDNLGDYYSNYSISPVVNFTPGRGTSSPDSEGIPFY